MTDEKKSPEETMAPKSEELENSEEVAENDPILEGEQEATESLMPESQEETSEDLDEEKLFLSPDDEEDELFLSPDEDGGEVVEFAEALESADSEELRNLRTALEEEQGATAQLRENLQELQQSLESLETEKEELHNRYLRSVADLENFRRRTDREKAELKKYGIEKVVADLVPAVDNMERALVHAAEQEEGGSLVEGIEMVYRQILSALKKYGVEPFVSRGQPFDPQRHEAIQQVESTEHDTGTIVEEYQKGYFIHDRLLRPALVVVAKRVDPPQDVENLGEPEEAIEEDSAVVESAEDGDPSLDSAAEEKRPRRDEEGGEEH